MKNTPFIIAMLSAAALVAAVGCKQESAAPPVPEASRDTAGQLDKMKQETKEAITATKDYAYAQRSEYAAKIRAELAVLNLELDQLSAKMENSSAAAKAEAKAKLQGLREQVSRLNEKLDGVQAATESSWDQIKDGVKQGYEEVKDSFKQARQWLSEKIAP